MNAKKTLKKPTTPRKPRQGPAGGPTAEFPEKTLPEKTQAFRIEGGSL